MRNRSRSHPAPENRHPQGNIFPYAQVQISGQAKTRGEIAVDFAPEVSNYGLCRLFDGQIFNHDRSLPYFKRIDLCETEIDGKVGVVASNDRCREVRFVEHDIFREIDGLGQDGIAVRRNVVSVLDKS